MAMIQQKDRDKAKAVAGAIGAPLLSSVSQRDREEEGEEEDKDDEGEDDEDEEEIEEDIEPPVPVGEAYFPLEALERGGEGLKKGGWAERLFREEDMKPHKNFAYCRCLPLLTSPLLFSLLRSCFFTSSLFQS